MIYEYRNPAYSSANAIDCEINHPEHGWIPYTCHQDENTDLYEDIVSNNTLDPFIAPAVPETDIDAIRSVAKNKIDTLAERLRSRFITTGSGQALTYLLKEDEALTFKNAGYPEENIDDYPYIKIDMSIFGLTAKQAADNILAIASQVKIISPLIEQIRLQGKEDVKDQLSTNGINAVVDNVKQQFDDLLEQILAAV